MTLIFFSPRVVCWSRVLVTPTPPWATTKRPTHSLRGQGVRKLCRCNNSWTICYTLAQLEAPANIRGVGWVLSMWWWTSTPHPPSDIGTIHSVSTSRSTIHVAHYTQQNRCSSTTHRDREYTIQSVSRSRRASTRSGPRPHRSGGAQLRIARLAGNNFREPRSQTRGNFFVPAWKSRKVVESFPLQVVRGVVDKIDSTKKKCGEN